jgi:hypothetical protein
MGQFHQLPFPVADQCLVDLKLCGEFRELFLTFITAMATLNLSSLV